VVDVRLEELSAAARQELRAAPEERE
jgi:hypothetical protein